MRTTLAFNGSYFNTNRMVKQYTRNAYYPVKLIEKTKMKKWNRRNEEEDSRTT
jgi:starch phosphorylase